MATPDSLNIFAFIPLFFARKLRLKAYIIELSEIKENRSLYRKLAKYGLKRLILCIQYYTVCMTAMGSNSHAVAVNFDEKELDFMIIDANQHQ